MRKIENRVAGFFTHTM